MSQLTLLYDLQIVDSEILEKKTRLGAVLGALKEPAEIVKMRALLEKKTEAHTTVAAKQRDLELQVGSMNAKLKASQDKLYSGEVTNAKELTDMQAESQSLTRRVATGEDEILTLMGQVEGAEAERVSAETDLNNLLNNWQAEETSLNQEKTALAVRLNELLQSRKAQMTKIERPLLEKYERIRKKKRGLAVVTLKLGNSCTGCSLSASVQTVKAVSEGRVVSCSQCGRIIVAV